jgi:predicted ABC-type ATPase
MPIPRTPVSASPRCIIIAGPNGAGKTTFAREFLPRYAGVVHFVNADLIAAGLSPLRPALVTITAGRLFLSELDRLAKARADFAFETALSGLGYTGRLKRWKAAGYRVSRYIYASHLRPRHYLASLGFLRLSSVEVALHRIAERVKEGGHNVARADVVRRYKRGLENFEKTYRLLADSWTVYDNAGDSPILVKQEP